MSKSKKPRNISLRRQKRLAIATNQSAENQASAALRDLLVQLKAVGLYCPGVAEGMAADYEGLSFARAEAAIAARNNAPTAFVQDIRSAPVIPAAEAMPPRVLVVMDGGLIHEVLSDAPVSVLVVDYDVEGADEDQVVDLRQNNNEETAEATLSMWCPTPEQEVVQLRYDEFAVHTSELSQAA